MQSAPRVVTSQRVRAAPLTVIALVLVGVLAAPGAGLASNVLSDAFIDPTDGAFDTSNWLLEKRGFLPVPILVTEPAVGYGGGAALLFFHRTEEDIEAARQRAEEKEAAEQEGADEGAPTEVLTHPPSISFAAGLGTESKSWLAGGGHYGIWLGDRVRTLTMGGYSSLNVDYYVGDTSFPYNIEGFLVSQEVLLRIRSTDFFLGGAYGFQLLDPTFGATSPSGEGFDLDADKNAGFAFIGAFDNRDNIFTPNRGQYVRVDGTLFRDNLGGDHDWELLETSVITYHPLFDEKLVVGLRAGADFAFNDSVFYMEPYVDLRGVAALRYQDVRAGEGELELRWRVWRRFSLIGFAGVGWVDGEKSDAEDIGPIPAGGFGFRYLMARRMGMHTGVDFAWSEDTFAFYIQVGSAW